MVVTVLMRQCSFPISLLIPFSVFPGTTSQLTVISSSASGRDLGKTESMHMSRGRNIQRSSFARVPDGSWRGEMRDTRESGGENGVYCSSHILLSKPFMEVVTTNEAGWMNTDPIVCTHGRPHGNSQQWLREKVVRRSCVMTQVKAAMQVSDQHSIPTPGGWGLGFQGGWGNHS